MSLKKHVRQFYPWEATFQKETNFQKPLLKKEETNPDNCQHNTHIDPVVIGAVLVLLTVIYFVFREYLAWD